MKHAILVRFMFVFSMIGLLTSASIAGGTPAESTEGRLEDQGLRSVQGRPIEVYVIDGGTPTVLVLAGVHGDEPEGVELARDLVTDLVKHSRDLQCRVVVAPAVNPDGLDRRTRWNANSIDVNRNFPTADFGGSTGRYYGGSAPGSEPETRAVMHLFDEYEPALILAFHAPLGCINYDGPASAFAEQMSVKNGFPVRPALGYATPGSMGTYYGKERRVPVVTLELRPGEPQWNRHGSALWSALQIVSAK